MTLYIAHLAQPTVMLLGGAVTWILWKKFGNRKSQPSPYDGELRVMGPNFDGIQHLHQRISCGDVQCSYDAFKWIVDILDSAEKTMDIAMYFISYAGFADALIRAQKRGVEVRIILQHSPLDGGSEWLRMRRAGIQIRKMNLPSSELMHQKMVVIDCKTVLFGSMNFTLPGIGENSEEMVKLRNPDMVRKFALYFHSIWDDMTEHDDFRASRIVTSPQSRTY